jgi:predicted permease
MSRRNHDSVSERIYAALMHVYPRVFRDQYGDEMLDYFRDRSRDERERAGSRGVARLWSRAVFDLASTALHEHVVAARATRNVPPSPNGDTMLQSLIQDLRFTGRMLRKSPVLTAVAVVIIALGTGAVSTIFSVTNAIVLRPLPAVADGSKLAIVERTRPDGGSLSASYPYYKHIATNSRTMNLAAWSMVQLTMSTGGEGVTALGNIVSGNYFDVLGVRPALGRFFVGDEIRVRDTYPVVVVSYGFWERQLAGDSAAIGRTILVNGSRFTVVGVAPKHFTGIYPVLRTDAWTPLMLQSQLRVRANLDSPGSAWLEMFGRLAPGVSRDEARTELAALTKQFATTPASGEPTDLARFTSAKLSAASGLPADAASAVMGFFAVLLALAGMVLLIASVNVATMLLARAVVRRKEIAVRLALGAARGRLIRQLLTESVALFVLGGAAGTAIAVWGTRLLGRIDLPVDMPMSLDLAPDLRALAVTLIVALLTGMAFGLAPALQASRLDFAVTLRGDTSGGGRNRSRLRNGLIMGQVALSLVLLSASGLFVRALDRGHRVDPGFDVNNVATAAMNVGTAGYNEVRARAFYRELATRLAALPGVMSVGYARLLPLSMNTTGTEISIDDYAPPGGRAGGEFNVLIDDIDEGYLTATRIPVIAGRNIRPTDDATAPRVAIVNQSFVNRYWPGRNPIGRTFHLDSTTVTVVGVVPDSKFARLNDAPAPFMFLPMAQHWDSGTNLLVRTTGDPTAVFATIRREIRALDSNLPPPTLTTLRQATSVALLPQRVAVAVTGVLGLLGLILAAVGLYGVLSFSAAQRSGEIGIRLALGALRRDVVGLVVREGMRLVGVGMVSGLLLALLATQALKPFLFGVSPLDPLTFVAIGATLASVALIASYLPARRAAAADPASSLRQG